MSWSAEGGLQATITGVGGNFSWGILLVPDSVQLAANFLEFRELLLAVF